MVESLLWLDPEAIRPQIHMSESISSVAWALHLVKPQRLASLRWPGKLLSETQRWVDVGPEYTISIDANHREWDISSISGPNRRGYSWTTAATAGKAIDWAWQANCAKGSGQKSKTSVAVKGRDVSVKGGVDGRLDATMSIKSITDGMMAAHVSYLESLILSQLPFPTEMLLMRMAMIQSSKPYSATTTASWSLWATSISASSYSNMLACRVALPIRHARRRTTTTDDDRYTHLGDSTVIRKSSYRWTTRVLITANLSAIMLEAFAKDELLVRSPLPPCV